MHFRIRFNVPFLAVSQKNGPIELSVPIELGPASVKIWQKPDQPPAHSWVCEAACEHQPNDKVMAIFTALHSGQLDPKKEWDQERGENGQMEFVEPPPYRDLLAKVELGLTDLAQRCITLIQWRLELRGNYRPLKEGSCLFWSFDGTDWRPIPAVSYLTGNVDCFPLPKVGESIQAEAVDLLKAGEDEPLGQELLREAIELRDSGNERTAFVIAVMAAEVGVKQAIMKLSPPTKHLLGEVQSQPLRNLLEGLLPLVSAVCTVDGRVFVPTGILDALESATKIRNKIIHQGQHPKYRERLAESIDAVRDLLYLLDFYRGHKWAWDYISDGTRKQLAAPAA